LCGIVGSLAILGVGCGGGGDPPAVGAAAAPSSGEPTPAAPTPAAPTPAAPTPAVARREVSLVDHEGVLAAVASHRGKVVVLDCWSTSCPPCIKEFPGLVALARNHPDRVVCLSLAFDYEGIGAVEDALGPVQEFLTSVDDGRLGNLHHMLGREDADALYRKMELDSVPAVYVWHADGSLAHRFDDDDATRRLGRPFTYADIEETVSAAIARETTP
jgi:thiol-disulfide isomerase/thioredoxin